MSIPENIIIGNEALDKLHIFLEEKFPKHQVVFIVDSNLYHVQKTKIDRLSEGNKIYLCPSDEKNKTMEAVLYLARKMLEDGCTRKTILINIGGGMTTDLGGFLASIFLRGISFIHIPTTLLAMVDASIGGKTGVDLACYKNVLGTFTEPECIFIDPSLLSTLPKREYSSGLAECVKHGCIADMSILEDLEGE